MPSSFTSFQDGDPSSPEHFNSKFGPLVDATVNATGIEILSDGSSLGTATKINVVGSSSVSSQAAGQISIAIPQITGTGSKYARFSSAGTGLEDANLQDSGTTVQHIVFATPSVIVLGRYGGSSSATTAISSNQSVASIEFWSSSSTGREFRGGSFRLWSQNIAAGDIGGRYEWNLQLNSSDKSVMELTTTDLSPTGASHQALSLGRDGGLWNRVNANQLRSIAFQPISLAQGTSVFSTIYGASPALPILFMESAGTEVRIGGGGIANASLFRLVGYNTTEAYLSPFTTEPQMRLGGLQGAPHTSRFHSLNVQGISARALHTLASYSATTADYAISVDSSSNLTVTLPTPSVVSGHFFAIKRAGAGTLEVVAGSGASIDNFSVYTLASQWSSVHVVSVGTRYIVL